MDKTTSEPRHGEERNRRWESRTEEKTFVIQDTGEEVTIPTTTSSGTVADRYCRVCKKWVTCGSGHGLGILGFAVCPECHTEWFKKFD